MPLWGLSESNNDIAKRFLFTKEKGKQVVIFLIKKPQTINKCKYIISEFTCKKNQVVFFSFNSFPALNCENKNRGGEGDLKFSRELVKSKQKTNIEIH